MLKVNELIGFGTQAASEGGAGLYRFLKLEVWDVNVDFCGYEEIYWMVGATDYPLVPMTSDNTPVPLVVSAVGYITSIWAAFNRAAGAATTGNTPASFILDLGAGNEITPTGVGITLQSAGNNYPQYVACYGSATGVFATDGVTLYPKTAQSGWTNDRKNITF